MSCSSDVNSPQRTPVLLVHSTFTTPQETWSWGYWRVLRAAGHPVCTVTLPQRAEIDLQMSVEYVVYAIHAAHSRSGQEIAVIGHSQGGARGRCGSGETSPAWSTTAIAPSGPQQGTDLGTTLCAAGRCPDVVWQMRTGSNWTAALTRGPIPTGVSFSSIGSRFEELIFPALSATTFPGATNVLVQDACPLRPVEHALMLSDAAVHALVMDAIGHPGPVRLDRNSRSVCTLVDYPGLDPIGRAGCWTPPSPWSMPSRPCPTPRTNHRCETMRPSPAFRPITVPPFYCPIPAAAAPDPEKIGGGTLAWLDRTGADLDDARRRYLLGTDIGLSASLTIPDEPT